MPNKKIAQRQQNQTRKSAQVQQQHSRKEAVSEYLGLDPDDLVSYREFTNNTVSALVPDGHKYWFIVTPNGENTGWDVVPL